MTGWQPISTAPKDGTLIDLWVINDMGKGHRVPRCDWDSWNDCWRQWPDTDSSYNDAMYDDEHPTHWMPLPSPPEAG